MIKTASEYLFLVVSGLIGMVRKDDNSFTVVPVASDGNLMVPFGDPDEYWKQWAALTNFSSRYSKIDFAFIVDDKNCRLHSEETGENDAFKRKSAFKRVESTVWSLDVVESALRAIRTDFNLNSRISLDEKGKNVMKLMMDETGEWQNLHLIRFGKTNDPVKEKEIATPSAKVKVSASRQKTPKTAAHAKQEPKKAPPPPKPIELAADCLGTDEKAKGLKAGDALSGVLKTLSTVRNRCFVESEGLSDQMRVLYTNLTEYCKEAKRSVPAQGDTLKFKVLSVAQTKLRIDLKLEIVG